MTNEEAVHRGLIVPGYRNQKSIRLLAGKADPRAVGVRAPLGSKFFQFGGPFAGSDFNKVGGGNFDWEPCCGKAAEETAAEEAITWDRERINFVDDDPATTVVDAGDATALSTAVAAAAAGDIIEVQNFVTVYDGFDFPVGINLIVRGQQGNQFNIREKDGDTYCVGLLDGSNGNTIARADFVPVAATSDGISDEATATGWSGLYVKSCIFTDCAVGINIGSADGVVGVFVEDCEFFDCERPTLFRSVVGGLVRECFNQGSEIGFYATDSTQLEFVLTTSVETTDDTEGDCFRFEDNSEVSLYGCAAAFSEDGNGFLFGEPAGGGTGQVKFQMINCVGNSNALNGVRVDAGSYGRITNSIFTENGTASSAPDVNGAFATGDSMIDVRSSWFNANDTGGAVAATDSFVNDMDGNFGFTGNAAGDPLFTDPAGFDFSVAGNSPVLGAGQNQADLGVNPERHHRTLDDRGQKFLFSNRTQDQAFFRPGVIADDDIVLGGTVGPNFGLDISDPTIFRRAAIQATIAAGAGVPTDILIETLDAGGTPIQSRTISLPDETTFIDIPSIGVGAGATDGLIAGRGSKLRITVTTAGGGTPPEDINVFLGGDVTTP